MGLVLLSYIQIQTYIYHRNGFVLRQGIVFPPWDIWCRSTLAYSKDYIYIIYIYIFFSRPSPGSSYIDDFEKLIILKTPASRASREVALRNRHASFTCQLKQLSTDLGNRLGGNKPSRADPQRARKGRGVVGLQKWGMAWCNLGPDLSICLLITFRID